MERTQQCRSKCRWKPSWWERLPTTVWSPVRAECQGKTTSKTLKILKKQPTTKVQLLSKQNFFLKWLWWLFWLNMQNLHIYLYMYFLSKSKVARFVETKQFFWRGCLLNYYSNKMWCYLVLLTINLEQFNLHSVSFLDQNINNVYSIMFLSSRPIVK